MKRILCFVLALVFSFSCLSCQKTKPSEETPLPQSTALSEETKETLAPALTQEKAPEPEPEPLFDLSVYDRNAYLTPFWEGEVVYHESVLPLTKEDGSVAPIPLYYEATKIFSVRSSDLKTEYEEGTDYYLEEGKLVIPEGSSVPVTAYSDFYFTKPKGSCMPLNSNYGAGYLFFKEESAFHSMQISVTYCHEDSFSGEKPLSKSALLPNTTEKLSLGTNLNVLLLGDSICVGANASSFVKAEPNAETFFDMTVGKLKEAFPEANITAKNTSLGGARSSWGVSAAQSATRNFSPDLCIIAFGMNDGTARVTAETYGANIQKIMNAVRKKNPDCEFILVSTMLPNAMASNYFGNQETYLPVLQGMEKEGVALCDMTTYHAELLAKKRYFDMTGNNVNHPNDFLVRAYAQNLLFTLCGDLLIFSSRVR